MHWLDGLFGTSVTEAARRRDAQAIEERLDYPTSAEIQASQAGELGNDLYAEDGECPRRFGEGT